LNLPASDIYPEVVDTSSLVGVFNLDQFLAIGIEGQKATAGTATVGTRYVVTDGATADALFGSASSLANLIKFVLAKGVNWVYAVASASNTTPTLVQRQTAWTALEDTADCRIRLTDSVTQADLVALADSAEWAEGVQNKQFAVMGLATPSTPSGLTTAAAAIASKRGLLVGPGIYDENGTLLSGAYAAAWVASLVSQNQDIADDLDTVPLYGSTGIERDAGGQMPIFRVRANAGTPLNDFNTLLNGGVSPLRQGVNGLAEIVHLRMTYTTDSTYDALMTLLIKDQVFIDIRTLLTGPQSPNLLRRGNTEESRSLAAALVDNYLRNHNGWVQPKFLMGSSTPDYGVSVTASSDKREMTVSYQGEIVRNTQKIKVNGALTIPA
jgi:hypothetical protein